MTNCCLTCLGCLQRLKNMMDDRNKKLMLLHHQTAESLQAAASAGCPLCRVFWSQYNEHERKAILNYDPTDSSPINDIECPLASDGSGSAATTRKKMMQAWATYCMIEPGESLFRRTSLKLTGGISFNIMLSFERTLPARGQRADMCLFYLKPVEIDGTYITHHLRFHHR